MLLYFHARMHHETTNVPQTLADTPLPTAFPLRAAA
jgi:hypothetical protein